MVKDNRYSESQMVKQEFGMNISEACTTIDARVLPPPMVYFFLSQLSLAYPVVKLTCCHLFYEAQVS